MLLTNKRDLTRGKAPFDQDFLCTNRGVPVGIWINVEKSIERGREETLKEIDAMLIKLI